MNKGKVAPVDGNLDRAYGVCAKCKVKRLKSKMHAILDHSSTITIAHICTPCAQSGVKA